MAAESDGRIVEVVWGRKINYYKHYYDDNYFACKIFVQQVQEVWNRERADSLDHQVSES